MPARDRPLDRTRPELANAVAVRVRAVSCNYRDRSFIHAMGDVPAARYAPIGSEFVGEVVEVGPAVRSIRAGDRVIPNHHYTGGGVAPDGVREGVATNQASRRSQLLPEQKLLPIPSSMPDQSAAAFSLGAQTAYSIVRRLELSPGAPVLVTAASSNTALFLIAVLRRAGAVIHCITSAPERVERLHRLGADHVIVRPRGGSTSASDPLQVVARELGGFCAVADPFFDLHFAEAVHLLRPFGRYVTCGLAEQNTGLRGVAPRRIDASAALVTAIEKNLTLIGNCLGLTSDLLQALHDSEAGLLRPVIDSVFDGDQVQRFFNRTYNDASRFGKVVYRYDD
jgi:NADPH:quinone reductase-like Zn-dependent oxidoreductase